jgi:hypothetical protein
MAPVLARKDLETENTHPNRITGIEGPVVSPSNRIVLRVIPGNQANGCGVSTCMLATNSSLCLLAAPFGSLAAPDWTPFRIRPCTIHPESLSSSWACITYYSDIFVSVSLSMLPGESGTAF